MAELQWCFFGFSGGLRRQEFALALFFCVLVRIFVEAKLGTPPLLGLMLGLPFMALLVKRMRHVGLSSRAIVIGIVVLIAIILANYTFGAILTVAMMLALLFLPGNSITQTKV